MRRRTVRRRRARRVVALLALVLELAAAVGLVVAVRGALAQRDRPPEPVPDADSIGAHPRAFEGADIAVAGRVGERPRRRSASDRWAFILRGRSRGRLLVVAARGHTMTVFREGVRVIVHGRVVGVGKRRSRSPAPSSRAALAARSGASAIVEATRISPAG
jgi:cytochrome c-type biogenesis protein CcmE